MNSRDLTRPALGWRAALVPVAVALGAGAICWYCGADVWHSIALGTAIAVICFAAAAVGGPGDTRDLRWLLEAKKSQKGSRNDVATLSWSLRAGWGTVGRTSEIRLRQLARRRLLMDGLDLENPDHAAMIEARIGAPVYRTLVRTNPQGLRVRTLTACLDALDALDPAAYPVPPERPRDRRFNRFPLRPRRYP